MIARALPAVGRVWRRATACTSGADVGQSARRCPPYGLPRGKEKKILTVIDTRPKVLENQT